MWQETALLGAHTWWPLVLSSLAGGDRVKGTGGRLHRKRWKYSLGSEEGPSQRDRHCPLLPFEFSLDSSVKATQASSHSQNMARFPKIFYIGCQTLDSGAISHFQVINGKCSAQVLLAAKCDLILVSPGKQWEVPERLL